MDDSIEINLRPRRQIAHRLLIQVALTHRAGLEMSAGKTPRPEDEETRFDLMAWLVDARAIDELSRSERRILETPLGHLHRVDIDDHVFALDAAFPLAWALNLMEADPARPETIDGGTILAASPSPDDETGTFLNTITLREIEEIAARREAAEVWLWRLQIERERRAAQGKALRAIEEVIADSVAESLDAGLIDDTVAGDFALYRTAIRDFAVDQIDFATLIATARLTALNWVCGYGASWEDVPLDVE